MSLALYALVVSVGAAEDDTALSQALGRTLALEGDFRGAAVEFRRAAMASPDEEPRAVFYGAAGYAYMEAGSLSLADEMMDRMEDANPDLMAPTMLLRAETASQRSDWRNAAFYFGSARRSAQHEDSPPLAIYASRHEAASRLRNRDLRATHLEQLGLPPEMTLKMLNAYHTYEAGRDKHPWLGGLLGIIPGFGYLYAGEVANAVRSMILNGLFIFAMVDTAEEDQWGAFAAVTFFEITWYSGSIYGGIDASHRYNRQRLEQAAQVMEGPGQLSVDYATLPLLTLSVDF